MPQKGLVLTDDQLAAGKKTLVDGKLTADQVDDLVSIFRGFLHNLATFYPLAETFTGLQDTATSTKAQKLAACLIAWQGNGFALAGFAATNANRSGFYYSIGDENYQIFEYAFGLFWDIPSSLRNGTSSNDYSTEGAFIRRY